MSSSEKETAIEVFKERSLRTTPPIYAPSLVISHGKKFRDQTFYIPSDRSHHVKSVPEMRGMLYIASCYGWLILTSRFSNECYLFNPATLTKIELPPLIDESFSIGVLSSPPSEPNCVVIFFSEKKNLCVFCRIGVTTWTQQELEHRTKENSTVIKGLRAAVSSNGKIYLFYYEGMAVIGVQGTFACIEPYENKCPRHLIPPSTNRRVYFLESCGETYQVFLLCLGLSEIVQTFVVLKLELSTMTWTKVESLGDKIFLLGASSASVSEAEFGAKGNCIYFFAHRRTNLYCFDMDSGIITFTQPCPTKFCQWYGPFWVVPNCKVQVKKQVPELTEEIQVNNSILPVEIMQKIFQSMYLSGSIRFRLASKAFISLTSPVRPLDLQTLSDSQQIPWLISLPKNNTKETCHFYHPIYTDSHIMNLSKPEGAIIRHAKFGWLLMQVGNHCIFFLNPLTLETIKLPRCVYGDFINISFSSPPACRDCVVYGHMLPGEKLVRMAVYHKHLDRWSLYAVEISCSFVPSHCNQVFHGGLFYSLSKDGKVGVFNPKESNEEDMWKVYSNLSVPDVSLSSTEIMYKDSTRSFLVECDDEILCVFVGYLGSPVHVYKLDQSKETKKWIKVESLGNKVMFLSHTTSILVPAVLKGTENRIYFPRFKKNASVFYSLKSCKYHSFGDQDSWADWIDTTEHWNCTWFQTTK